MSDHKPNFNSLLLTIVLFLCATMIGMGGYGLKKTADNSESLAGLTSSVSGLAVSASSVTADVRALQHDMMPRAEVQSQILGVQTEQLRLSSEMIELRAKVNVMELNNARLNERGKP